MAHYGARYGTRRRALSAAIGAKVRVERQGRGLTLDQLAEQAGVSRRMIINVEHGSANPSVITILRISDALGIEMQTLVEVPHGKPVKVVRGGKHSEVFCHPFGGQVSQPDVSQVVQHMVLEHGTVRDHRGLGASRVGLQGG